MEDPYNQVDKYGQLHPYVDPAQFDAKPPQINQLQSGQR
jgi:hypothetical protein